MKEIQHTSNNIYIIFKTLYKLILITIIIHFHQFKFLFHTDNSQGTLYANAQANDRTRAGTFLSGTTGQNGIGRQIVRGSQVTYPAYPEPPVVPDAQPDNSVVKLIPLRGVRIFLEKFSN